MLYKIPVQQREHQSPHLIHDAEAETKKNLQKFAGFF